MKYVYLRYLLSALLGATSAGIAYLATSFILSPAFSLITELLLFSASVMMSGAALLSFQKSENYFVRKTGYSTAVYWLVVVGIIFLAVMITYGGIAQGGVEYTEFVARQS